MAKSEYIQIRVSTEIKKKLQTAADAENRTLSNYLINAGLEKIKEEKKMKKSGEHKRPKYRAKWEEYGSPHEALFETLEEAERFIEYMQTDPQWEHTYGYSIGEILYYFTEEEDEEMLTEKRLTEIMVEEVERVIEDYKGDKEMFRISAVEAVDPLNESNLTEEEVRKTYRDWLEESIRA